MAGNPKAGRSPRELIRYEGDLEAEEPYEGVLFADAAFDEAIAGNCHFLDCAFRNVSFSGRPAAQVPVHGRHYGRGQVRSH